MQAFFVGVKKNGKKLKVVEKFVLMCIIVCGKKWLGF